MILIENSKFNLYSPNGCPKKSRWNIKTITIYPIFTILYLANNYVWQWKMPPPKKNGYCQGAKINKHAVDHPIFQLMMQSWKECRKGVKWKSLSEKKPITQIHYERSQYSQFPLLLDLRFVWTPSGFWSSRLQVEFRSESRLRAATSPCGIRM